MTDQSVPICETCRHARVVKGRLNVAYRNCLKLGHFVLRGEACAKHEARKGKQK